MPRAVNVVSAVAATTGVASARTSVMQAPSQQRAQTQMPQPKTRNKTIKAIKLISNAHHVDAATALAVNAASAMTVVKALNASQTALKPRFFLRIQYQMRLQPNKSGLKKILNLYRLKF